MRLFIILCFCLFTCVIQGCYAARRGAQASRKKGVDVPREKSVRSSITKNHNSSADKVAVSEPVNSLSTGKLDRVSQLIQDIRGQKDVTEMVGEVVAIGQPAIPALTQLLKEGTRTERSNVMYLLGKIKIYPAEAIPVIEKILDEKNVDRLHMALDLQRISPESAKAMSVIADEMKRGDSSTRMIIIRILSLNPSVDKYLPVLLDAINDPDPDVRMMVVETCGEIGAKNKVAGAAMVPALTKALDDKRSRVCAQAARALGLIGEPARSAIPALQGKSGDSNEQVRKAVAIAIGLINVEKPKKSTGNGKSLKKLVR